MKLRERLREIIVTIIFFGVIVLLFPIILVEIGLKTVRDKFCKKVC